MRKSCLKRMLVATVVLQVVAQLSTEALDSKTSKSAATTSKTITKTTAKTAGTKTAGTKTAAATSASSAAAHSTLISKASAAIKNRKFKDAHAHLKKLAATGDRGAHNLLGMIYENGLGVEKNMSQAVAHYEIAAQMGMASAQHRLGHLYFHGSGVPKDYKKARKWLRLSAAQGSREAREMLEQIPGVTQAELALKQAGDKFHEGGNKYQTGMNNLEHSWQGYADLVTIMQQVGTAGAQSHP